MDTSKSAPIPAKKEKLPKNVVWLSLAAMFNDMSGEIVGRALPLFLAGTLGISKSVIGLIEGFADTTSAIFKILSGWYSDKWGRRQRITAFGYSLTTVSRPLLLLTTNWVIPFISRFIDRAGKGIRTSPRDALIADSVSPEMRGRAFGLHRALDPLGAVFGSLGAAALLWYFSGSASCKSQPRSSPFSPAYSSFRSLHPELRHRAHSERRCKFTLQLILHTEHEDSFIPRCCVVPTVDRRWPRF